MGKVIYTLLIIVIYSCSSNSEESGKVDMLPKTGTYISSYLTIPKKAFTNFEYKDNRDRLHILVTGETETYNTFGFQAISNYYHDNKYDGYGLPTNEEVFSEVVKYINVYKVNLENEEELINDKVLINYNTYLDFIDSNYKNNSNIEFTKRLNEFNSKENELVSASFSLDFIENIKNTFRLRIEIFTENHELILTI